METFLQDLRFSLRMLVKNPGFAAVAAITLALGIGANTAIFSVVNAVLLRPLPYRDPSRLVLMNESSQQLPDMSVSYPNYLDWRDRSRSFERIAAVQPAQYTLSGVDRPERLGGWNVTADFFATLGVTPVVGRDLSARDDRPGAPPVALLTYGLWQRRFGGDPSVVGRALTLSGRSVEVVGVLPQTFRFYYGDADLFLPLGIDADRLKDRGDHPGIYVVARLKPGATPKTAFADMDAIARSLEAEHPETNSGNRVAVKLLQDDVVSILRPVLVVLAGAVGFVLLIACANVANLLLARASTREKEIAIRRALGASRRRVLRQVLTESALLSLLGGGLGLLLAAWLSDVLLSLVPAGLPRMDEVRLDGTVLGFTLLLSLLTGLVFGIAPAWQASRSDVLEPLKETARGSSSGRGQQRFRSVLVVSEVALALVLLAGAGLMARSFERLQEVRPGFRPGNVLSAQLVLPEIKYKTRPEIIAFADQLLARVGALPGVEAAGTVNPLPLTQEGWQTDYQIEGRPVPARGEAPNSDYHVVSGAYFKAMGIPLVRGRLFDDSDREDTTPVVLVNETLARRYWPEGDAVGKRMRTGSVDQPGPWLTVVGVVGDVRQYGLDQEQKTQFYRPGRQLALHPMSLVLRAQGDPEALAAAVRRAVQSIDPDQPIYNVRSMDSLLATTLAPRRLSLLLLAAFAMTALLLAGVGIYGVLAYSVTQRTHEIGIRMALGARRADVLVMILRQGIRLVLIGAALGVAAAFGLTRLMSSLLFGVSPTDPATLGAVCLVLVGVALLACIVPARRASGVDPMIALRCE
jgi:putative ABC transport system permease protein